MNKGFTLVELLVVLGIIGILAALVSMAIKESHEPEDPKIKRCVSERVELLDGEGSIISWEKMQEIKTHCGYVNKYE